MSVSDLKDYDVVIAAAARAPMGGFQGELSGLSGTELVAAAIRAAIVRACLVAGDF